MTNNMKLPLLFLAILILSGCGSVHGFLYHPSTSSAIAPRIRSCGSIPLNLANDTNANDSSDDNHGKKSHTMEHDLSQEINKRSQQMSLKDDISPPVVPMPSSLSFTSPKFRQQERELLRDLLEGDDAVSKLRQLWFGEKGPKMAAPLALANACIGKGPTRVEVEEDDNEEEEDNWTKAERILLELIDQDPTFLEPFVRLSKLYTLQGRFADSQQICLALFAKRPWHYVVLETMVVNTMVLEHNRDLKRWASKRLPPPSLKEERMAWVKQAIADSIRLEEESVGLQQRRQVMEQNSGSDQIGKDDDEDRLDWQ